MLESILPTFGRYSPPSAFRDVLLVITSPLGTFLTVVLAVAGAACFSIRDEKGNLRREAGHKFLFASLCILFVRAFCRGTLLSAPTRFGEYVSTAYDIALAIGFGVAVLGIPFALGGAWILRVAWPLFSGETRRSTSAFVRLIGEERVVRLGTAFTTMSFLSFIWQPFLACILSFIAGAGLSCFAQSKESEGEKTSHKVHAGVLLHPLAVSIVLGLVWADSKLLW